MCLELLNENSPGVFDSSTHTHHKQSSLQATHPKVMGVFTIGSYLPSASSVLSHVYENTSNESKQSSRLEEESDIDNPLSVLMLHGKR